MENNIKNLWRKQSLPAAAWSDMLRKINGFKRKKTQKIINTNTILLFTITLAIFIWMYFEPQLIITKIGIILLVFPIGIAIIFNHKLLLLYKGIDERQTNTDYLNNLLIIREKEGFIQTKVLNLYFILLSAGIGLYMYEYAWKRSLLFGLVAYSVILLWVGFNWFFLRPRIIKKNKQKFEELIAQIKSIKSQIA